MLKILIILVLLLVIFLLRHALVPLCVGITIAYILNPFVDYLEKKFGGKRFLCVIVSYLAVITAVAFLIWGFADIIAGKMATGSLQEAISSLQVYYNEYKGVLNELFGFSIEGPNISHLLQSFGGGAVKFLIGMIA